MRLPAAVLRLTLLLRSGQYQHGQIQSQGKVQGTLLTEGAIYVAVEVIQQAVALLSLPVFLFFLSIEDFGIITTAIVVSQASMFLSTFGVDFAVLRFYYEWPVGERSELTSGVMAVVLLWSGVLATLCVFFPWGGATDVYRASMVAGAVGGIALGVRNIPLAVVRVTGQTRLYATSELGAAIARTLLQLWLVARGGGALGYMVGYAIAPIASTLLLVFSAPLRQHWHRPRLVVDTRLWGYTASILPSFAFSRFLVVADRAVLVGWATVDELGIYGAASRFSTSLKLLTGGFKMAIAPALSRVKDGLDSAQLFFSLSRLLLLTMLLVGSAIMLAAWAVQFTSWAPHWIAVQRLVALLVFGQFLAGFAVILQTRFYYSAAPGRVSRGVIWSAVSLIVCLVLLVPSFGIVGAAVSHAAASAVNIAVLVATDETARSHSWHRLGMLTVLFLPTVVGIWLVPPDYQLYILVPTFIFYGVATATTLARLRRPHPAS